MNKPKADSIEAKLVSLSLLAGALCAVLLLALLGVQQALGGSVQQLQSSTVPAQQSMAGIQHAVARLFQRQVQLLATRTQAELDAYKARTAIDEELVRSRAALGDALTRIAAKSEAATLSRDLDARTRALLEEDQALFDSVWRRHGFEENFDTESAKQQAELSKLIQETRAVSGKAHLEYVLALRRITQTPSPAEVHELVFGAERVQQESAERAVASVLHLGQLVGKIALARNDDELNSIAANELAQNLERSRSYLHALLLALDPQDPFQPRAQQITEQFERVATGISDQNRGASLMSLRRSVLSEAQKGAALRGHLLDSVKEFSSELERIQSLVAAETQRSARAAQLTLWLVRIGTLIVFAAAAWVGVRSVRNMRESVRALNAQNEQLESLSHDLKQMNEGLEGLVAQRSAELVRREKSMRLVLDAMDEALVMVDLSGNIAGESSKAALTWFGAPAPAMLIWEYLLPAGSKLRDSFRIGFEQLAEDLLPFEVSVDCLPRRLERDGRIFALSYRQVFEEGRFGSVLVAARDITSQVAAEGREREAHEQQMLLANLLKDKSGFRAFVRDGEGLLADLRTQPERDITLRVLHTLKGNTAVYGMESVARYCHALEERVAENGQELSAAELDELSALWRGRIHKIEEMVTTDAAVELAEADYSEILHGIKQRKDYEQLMGLVESWKWSATSAQLQRLSRQVRRVAEREGKPVEVVVEHNRLRVMPGPLDAFWGSLVHVVRNAVDHGIETPAERVQSGKPERGRITLRTARLPGGGFSVELADDGRGIDFGALARVAQKKQLPAATRDDLIAAMFHDGITTREEATELSGRGVGLAAVASICESAGGTIDVNSDPGRGTTFRFVFPGQAVKVREGATESGTFFHSARPPALRVG